MSGLRESDRLAPATERGAVVGVFYGLAYLGMFAPYLLGFAGRPELALLMATGIALGSLAVVTAASSSAPRA